MHRGCAAQTFQSQVNMTSCVYAQNCSAGFEEVQGSLTIFSDRLCRSCALLSTFKAIAGQSTSCQAVSNCQAGFEQTAPPTISSDRVCSQCGVGRFKSQPGQSVGCTAVSICPAGSYQSAAATPSSDTVCRYVTLQLYCFDSLNHMPCCSPCTEAAQHRHSKAKST